MLGPVVPSAVVERAGRSVMASQSKGRPRPSRASERQSLLISPPLLLMLLFRGTFQERSPSPAKVLP